MIILVQQTYINFKEMLHSNEYHPYFQSYLDNVLQNDKTVVENLKSTFDEFYEFLQGIPESKHDFAYAEGKWTIKELLQHIIDAERVFAYRMLRFVRNDKTELNGFDENAYAEVADVSNKSFQDLIEEYKFVRLSTISLLTGLSDEELQRQGMVGGNNASVRAIGYIVSGHQIHHQKIMNERYL